MSGTLTGLVDGTKENAMTLSINHKADKNKRYLVFEGCQFGRLLEAFNKKIDCEKVVIKAHQDLTHAQSPWIGNFQISHVRLIQAPMITHLLHLLSPFIFFEAFSTEHRDGLNFTYFQGNFKYQDLFLYLFSSFGSNLHLTLSMMGSINFQDRTVNLLGSLTPLSFLNTFFNHIPFIGTLLSGGKGEGLFSIIYRIQGSLVNPTLSTNPISLFAPGFLRKLLYGYKPPDRPSLKERKSSSHTCK